MSVIEAFGEDIWVVEGDQVRLFTIPFETRMTVIRLSDGGLWVHSPVAATAPRLAAVEALGPVAHVVAPNKFHHLFVGPWLERFPGARAWAGPGLAKKRTDLPWTHELDDVPPVDWSAEIDQLIFGGTKFIPEAVFYHRRSKSLIVTDIVQNHRPEKNSRFWRWVKGLNGIMAPDGGCPRDWRLTVRDRDTARAARDRMLAWPFDRVVLSHGRCITEGAHAHIERAFRWLDR